MTVTQQSDGVEKDKKIVFFFDIDNCLYPKSYKIHDKMAVLIDEYFQKHLDVSQEDAYHLHQRYYKDYGLAIEGLVRHHKVDPMEYNRQVDDALPLDEIIKPNPKLRTLLQSIDRDRVRPWLFTNAYVTHGKRVVKLLGVEDLFEGITYCDYAAAKFVCKPSTEMFEKAMREADVDDVSRCYFVGEACCLCMFTAQLLIPVTDDSALNVRAATKLGWKTAHLVEPSTVPPEQQAGTFQITSLHELCAVFPDVFRS